jgi:segregation and condensation protein A
MQNNNLAQLELPTVMGQQFEEIPDDLFIPPYALEICLETFSGPLDLLLYLIKKENINILDLDVSKITDQYLEYIELMDSLKFDLVADYLVMAATLAEIKSRLMLPKESFDEEEEDPRTSLIQRLQEYQRFRNVSEKIALLPRVDRDFFTASAKLPNLDDVKTKKIVISKDEIFNSIIDVINRPNYQASHLIDFEELSTKERIQIILDLLSKSNIISFSKTLRKPEGRKGVVVTLLASLDLAKDGYVELIQNKSEELFIKSSRRI